MDVFPEDKRRAIMARVKNRDTRQELLVRSLLHRLGFRFRLHRTDLPGSPDIVLPKHRTVIFVHGCFWHGHECPRGKLPSSNTEFWRSKIARNRDRDHAAERELEAAGWRVLVVWGCETSSVVKLTELGHRLVRELGDTEKAHAALSN